MPVSTVMSLAISLSVPAASTTTTGRCCSALGSRLRREPWLWPHWRLVREDSRGHVSAETTQNGDIRNEAPSDGADSDRAATSELADSNSMATSEWADSGSVAMSEWADGNSLATSAVEGPTRAERKQVSNADALLLMADTFLASGPAERTGGDRQQVVVHVDASALTADRDVVDVPERAS